MEREGKPLTIHINKPEYDELGLEFTCLLYTYSRTAAAHVSLLGSFEIAATAVIALLLFRERISRRVWACLLYTSRWTAP